LNILIIDDNLADRRLLCLFLEDAAPSIEITEAENATDGIELIRAHTYDCVFLDYMLPDMDGIDLLKEIHDPIAEMAPHPIVMLTGIGNEAIIIDALNYGAQDYLTKNNLSPDTLMSAISKARHVFNIKKEQNETKAQLNQSQKIEALGKLTGGIAHDFNNILTIVIGNARLIKDSVKSDDYSKEKTEKRIDAIDRAAQRGASLVQHLMVFSHQRSLNPTPLNMNHVLHDIEDLLRRTIGSNIKVRINADENLWATCIDEAQLEHMVINFCANARDAMPDGGDVKITTSNIILDLERSTELGLKQGEYVHLSIADNGSGIPDDVMDRIFEPFFTTKDAGKGTGLGMSMAHSFIKDCGGEIAVHSQKDEGTTFDIYFPKAEHEIKEEETNIKFTPKSGRETILVVEDEPEIRELAVSVLREQGYTIIETGDADVAIEILADPDVEIEMLFTDIVLESDINGIQLAARALVLRPELKVLFTTGFIKGEVPDMNLLDEYTVLNKPYNPNDLLQEIQKTLEEA